jgi:dTDP-4-amino-4,6-dideoxygalactose transaminase
MADMDSIMEQAERYGLLLIEDACQAHGAMYLSKRDGRWHKAGSMGVAAAFSFYPGKNLGACGEAGAVTTCNEQLAAKVRMLRDHGQAKKYYHDVEGYNGRLDSIQAGILRVKLAHLADWNEKRRQAAARYRDLLAEDHLILPYEPPITKPVYHLFVIQVDDREGLRTHLADEGIGTGIHYPIPLHLQKPYEALNYRKGSLPVAEQCASRILSLPMFPQLQAEQQNIVVHSIAAFVSSRASPALTR